MFTLCFCCSMTYCFCREAETGTRLGGPHREKRNYPLTCLNRLTNRPHDIITHWTWRCRPAHREHFRYMCVVFIVALYNGRFVLFALYCVVNICMCELRSIFYIFYSRTVCALTNDVFPYFIVFSRQSLHLWLVSFVPTIVVFPYSNCKRQIHLIYDLVK